MSPVSKSTFRGMALNIMVDGAVAGGFMIWVVRLTALVLELVGLFYTVKLSHKGEYGAAFLLFIVDTAIIVAFVLSHCFVEKVLDRYERKKRINWWL
jgi:heme/copper-type cytochrome/quinol oxidase subunit 4